MGGSRVSFSGCLYRQTRRIEGQVGMLFQMAADLIRGGIREFVYDTDIPAFLTILVGFSVDRYR